MPELAREDDLADLLIRTSARDAMAFATLYKLTSAKLYGVAAAILGDGTASADVLQEAYFRIWEKAAQYDRAKGSPLAWMASIARNRAIDEVRRVRPIALDDLPESFEPASEAFDPMASRERCESLVALLDCLSELDDESRSLVLLAYYHGVSRDALAKRFGRPVPTIKTWLRRSLAQLRDGLTGNEATRERFASSP